ncbi:hypothetical protein KAFR_0I01300 [Kazachstania africana CBS 2517]|uniref:Bile pigment transporter 1 n=1 Tax=Kazachstania africana (strain ATCC 22294 / BCRC 22015 / CBS 2517 / CECT 1963 / NBRC 1671 / NRRL Y-8276) TaxID=1071382 RepID=H2AZW1_KAZAF|nr:hypothetical protein KAFR_0I01300 [Kazachstania africana CBS 2517]CCF59911.1 hypothetical protein KAFR_0I01300 [Kazachstania africana CBS 2517]
MNSISCPYGYRPYPGPSINALNPCFLALCSSVQSVFFIMVGFIQLVKLFRTRKCPPDVHFGMFKFRKLSRRHILHLSSICFQITLVLLQLFEVLYSESYPPIIVWALSLKFLFTLCVSLPTQYLEYFKSICSIGNQLFYYFIEIFFLLFQVVQRSAHNPDDRFNVIKGNVGQVTDILLLLNTAGIFLYDVAFYESAPEIRCYYEKNNWYPEVHIFANLTYTWMNKLIVETYNNGKLKDPENLPLPPIDLDIRSISDNFQSKWENEKWNGSSSLLKAILKTFGLTMLGAMFFETIKDLLSIVEAQLLRLFIMCFNTDASLYYPVLHGVFIAVALFLTSVVSTMLNNRFYIIIFQAGLGIRGSLMTLVYKKALNLSLAARQDFSTGDIINFSSVDVLRIQRFFENSQTIIGAPIQIVVVLFSLYFLLGNAIIAGLVMMVIMLPVNSYLSKKVKTLTKTQMKYKDARIKTITEILNSMKSIKLYAWEKPMMQKLDHVRNDLEIGNLKKIGIASNLIYFAWNCVPLLVTCSTFGIFTLISDEPLTPELVFPALSLFNILNEAIYAIPSTINTMIEVTVSLNRLKKFLLSEELDRSFIEQTGKPANEYIPAVEIENATFLWKSQAQLINSENDDSEANIETTQVALKNIDHFTASPKSLTCVIGKVGSGKTTLLKAILGQLPCISGSKESISPKLSIRGESIAYCPQEAWIMNDTIKENILFGHKFDETYYTLTVAACELLADFDILPDGDQTLVGEKGISLSGGQKARVSLARAVYSRADIYLLDDILSAVDAGVSKKIVENVLDSNSGLLRNKTVILSTNTVSVLKHSQLIYALENGIIVERGNYNDIIESANSDDESKISALLKQFDVSLAKRESSNLSLTSKSQTAIPQDSTTKSDLIEDVDNEMSSLEDVSSRRASLATLRQRPLIRKNNPERKTKLEAEKTAVGSVKMSVYITYAKACGITGVFLFFIFLILSRIFDLCETFWLKHWSEVNKNRGSNEDVWKFVAVYALIGLGSAAFNIFRTIIMLLYCSIRGSKTLHDSMAKAIIRSPVQFFETTPIGRVINRFSSDIDSVDVNLQNVFSIFFRSILDYILTVILVSVAMPWFLLFNALIMIIYFYYEKLYIVQSRELKRLTSIAYSPIISLMSETLGGQMVISAYNHSKMFKFMNIERVQYNLNVLFTFRSTNRWLSIRLQSIGAFIILCTGLLALTTLRTSSPIGSGLIGLLMSYVLQVTSALTWIVRSTVQIETNIVSVERILEYCHLPPEAEDIIDSNRVERDWPQRGSIEFKNYTTTYRANLSPVLKNISVTINPSEKVGIVGRTGAGKSTLSLALFRILEAAEGTIFIDGVDISRIGLTDLRGNMAIIPQDAQAFEGTVRSNLDPFQKHTDVELWNVIELSHLKPHVLRMAEDDNLSGNLSGLDAKINENGSNLSVGQRQLLCLARALLNQSKVLVLDEATAAVDVETDKIIQETIRTQFKDRTILTIAHRLDTIMDNDKILVLDAGGVKEFDSPKNLLSDESTLFYQLCDKGNYLKK